MDHPRSRDRVHPCQHSETPSLLKIQKISWAWWSTLVIPTIREAEAGELPEPRRRRLRWAEIAPLHFSLGNSSETPSQKKITTYSLFKILISLLLNVITIISNVVSYVICVLRGNMFINCQSNTNVHVYTTHVICSHSSICIESVILRQMRGLERCESMSLSLLKNWKILHGKQDSKNGTE